jgi:hypothetical protein
LSVGSFWCFDVRTDFTFFEHLIKIRHPTDVITQRKMNRLFKYRTALIQFGYEGITGSVVLPQSGTYNLPADISYHGLPSKE